MTRGSLDFRPATVDVYFAPGADITWRIDVNDSGITVGTVAVTIDGVTPSVSTAASTTNHLIVDITLSDTQTAAIGEKAVSWQLSNTTTGVTVIWVTGTLMGSPVGNRLTSNGTSQVVTSAGTATVTSLVGASSTAALVAHEADTTNIHGIADTSVLATATSVATAISTHAGATDPHGDRAYADGLAAGLQPLDSDLTAIAALSTTTYGRALLALADAAALRTAGGLAIGTDVQAYSSVLAGTTASYTTAEASKLAGIEAGATGDQTAAEILAALLTVDGTGSSLDADLLDGQSSAYYATAASLGGYQPIDSDLTALAALTTTAYGRALLELANAAALRTAAGLVIGTDVQAQDAELAAIAGLTSAADRLPYFTGSGTASLAAFTAAGRALVDDADATAQRTTLGLGTISTQAANSVAITGGSVTGITDITVADGGTGASNSQAARDNLSAQRRHMIDARDSGVVADGVTDDTTALQLAVDTAIAEYGDVLLPVGTIVTSAPIVITGACGLIGRGTALTTIAPTAALSTGSAVVLSPSTNTANLRVSGLAINLGNCKTATGIYATNIYDSTIDNVAVYWGAYGINLVEGPSGFYRRISLRNQTTAGIRVNGDNGTEIALQDIRFARDEVGTTDAGILYERTTSTDTGGMYVYGCHVVNSGAIGTINSGFRFVSTASGAATDAFLFVDECVSDGVNGSGGCYEFTNCSTVSLVNSWASKPSSATAANIIIDGGSGSTPKAAGFKFLGNTISAGTSGAAFNAGNSPTLINIVGNNCLAGGTFLAGSGFGSVGLSGNMLASGMVVAGNPTALAAATTTQVVGGYQALTSNSGANQTFRLTDLAQSYSAHLRAIGGTSTQKRVEYVDGAFGATPHIWYDDGRYEATSRVSAPSIRTTAWPRPTPQPPYGTMIWDAVLLKPIWSDGTDWRDAAGTVV